MSFNSKILLLISSGLCSLSAISKREVTSSIDFENSLHLQKMAGLATRTLRSQ